jgi:hypothetical protein
MPTGPEFVRIRGILFALEPSQTDALAEEVIGARSDVARWLGARPTRIQAPPRAALSRRTR